MFVFLPSAAWVAEEDTGYGQEHFQITCSACGLRVTKEALGVKRFVDDLIGGYLRLHAYGAPISLASAREKLMYVQRSPNQLGLVAL